MRPLSIGRSILILSVVVALAGLARAQEPLADGMQHPNGIQQTLPYNGTISTTGTAFGVLNTGAGAGAVGVAGRSDNGYAGVVGYSAGRYGVFGISVSATDAGVFGRNEGEGIGVLGRSASGYGVQGQTTSGFAGVYGTGPQTGVLGASTSDIYGGVYGSNSGEGPGVFGQSANGPGVQARSTHSPGLIAESVNGHGVFSVTSHQYGSGVIGIHTGSNTGDGVTGLTDVGCGVCGDSSGPPSESIGVRGRSYANNGNGVIGVANTGTSAYGVWGQSSTGYAGYFSGRVFVNGTLSKSAGAFEIDHPLEPATRVLRHSFVESPDMKNVYDGVITTDKEGLATVALPNYFEALNRDFRYQLTILGKDWAQARIEEEVRDNHFVIRTDKPHIKVSWQVTGIRQDVYATAHPIIVEEDKPSSEQGFYHHPDLFGQPETKSIEWSHKPDQMKSLREERPATLSSHGRP